MEITVNTNLKQPDGISITDMVIGGFYYQKNNPEKGIVYKVGSDEFLFIGPMKPFNVYSKHSLNKEIMYLPIDKSKIRIQITLEG